MRIPLFRARVEVLAVAIALIAGAQAGSARAQGPALAPQVAVAPGALPPELAFARSALAEHVRLRLAEAAVELAEGPGLRARLDARESGEAGATCALVAAAAADGATRVLLADLRTTDRGVDVALRVYEPRSCKLESAARASGTALALGPALDTALGRVLPSLGGSAELLSPIALGLGQLAAESRAIALIDERELVRAWRALVGDTSPLSGVLRARIDTLAAERETSSAERVRLHSARGLGTPNDVSSRQIMMQAALSLDGEVGDPRVLLAAGELQLKRGEAGEARRYLERAATLAPDNPDVHLGYGRALALLQDDGAARRSFERAAELEPASTRALDELALLESDEPALQAALLLRTGQRASLAFDEPKAQADFARAVQLDPLSAPIAKERAAELYVRLGDPGRARASWQEAIDAGGVTPARILGVARASRALGDPKAAETAFQRAVELDPKADGAALGLGTLYTESGRFAEARPWLERAVALAPRDAEAKRGLAVVLHQAGESEAALELLDIADRTGRPSPNALRMRATILRLRGDSAGARASLAHAVEIDPVDADLRRELAAAHELLGDGSAAGLERQNATLLTSSGEALAGAGPRPGAETQAPEPGDDAPVDERLAALLQSFGSIDSETGRVVLLGVRERIDYREAPLECVRAPVTCLTPKVPDGAELDRALARVIGAQHELIPHKEIEETLANLATQDLVRRLFRFESESSLDANSVSQLNAAFGSDALFIARVETAPRAGADDDAAACGGETPWRLDLRQLSGRSPVTTRILGNALCLDARGDYARWNRITLTLLGVVGAFLGFHLVRGWGNVEVRVELPPRTRALFSISLSRRPRKPQASKSQKSRERAKSLIEEGLRRLNRYERPLREGAPTLFTWIPARWRSFYVTVRGPLMNTTTGELIGDFLEEQVVRVRRGKAAVVKFDLRPKEATVEILVTGIDRSSGPVALALRGVPSSLRYANDGGVFLYLQVGRHVLLVGVGDRLLERMFEIRTLDPMRMTVELGRPQEWLFTGSAAAVTAYLEGDATRAANELERAGEVKAASKIRAKILRAKSELDVAAEAKQTGPDVSEAAAQKVAVEDRSGAAALFDAAGEFAEAAETYRAAGDLAAAARAYERAGDYASAIECAKQTADDEYLLALYEKNGDSFEAGELAARARQTLRAIHAFSQVDRIDPNYRKACQRLVELHSERNQFEPALEKLEELVKLEGGEKAPLPLRSLYARLLETLGRGAEALSVWEAIAARDPSFKDAASRVAALRGVHRGPAPAETPTPSPAAPTESRYEILEELGRGAMGVVYKARDKHLGRVVALKRLTDNLRGHPTAIAYFEREARSAAVLSHPNIVVVYDAGQENGHYFITMEHLQGTTLEQIVKTRGAMSAAIVAALGIQVCAGLHYAHTNKIIHRDIKTGNLFFTRERIVKIMDFGLAKMVEEVRKGATMIGGTPYYMAPEQALGENVDHRADLYALGVTFFNLLTNAFPFESGDVTFHHRNTPAPDVRERVASIPAEMAALVAKLMSKSPEARYQTAAEIAHALQPIAVPDSNARS